MVMGKSRSCSSHSRKPYAYAVKPTRWRHNAPASGDSKPRASVVHFAGRKYRRKCCAICLSYECAVVPAGGHRGSEEHVCGTCLHTCLRARAMADERENYSTCSSDIESPWENSQNASCFIAVRSFVSCCGLKPIKCTDGVSEGEFEATLTEELPKIRGMHAFPFPRNRSPS